MLHMILSIRDYNITKVIEDKEEGKQAVGRERTESLISYFANETFQNATINDPEFEDFTLAKDEAYEWNDVLGQKAHVHKNLFISIIFSYHFIKIMFVDQFKRRCENMRF